MGLLDTSLQIGRSAIMAHSLAMDVVGNNLANAATEGYARQAVDLRSAPGVKTTEGPYLGLGVNADSIRRLSDMYLEQRLRDARSDSEGLSIQSDLFQRLEGTFNELSDSDLSTVTNEFFTALSTLQGNPEDRSVRRAVLESAATLTESVRLLRTKLDGLRTDLDAEITGAVKTANAITAEIANLNTEVSRLEAGSANAGSAATLRDRRDALLGQLSDIMDVRVVETNNGMVNIFAGPDPLVMGNRSYEMAIETRVDRGVAISDVEFASDGRAVQFDAGKLAGLVEARDSIVPGVIDEIDKWMGSFIEGFNRIYASGQGLDQYSSVTGANGVVDPAAALNAAGLDFAPNTGTFEMNVTNSTSGETKTFRFHVDLDGLNGDDTTLNSLAADINAVIGAYYPDMSAQVGPGNALKIDSASPEVTFTFANDTSGALAALGVNTFFTGHDSGDVGVNAAVAANPGLMAAALTAMPGDNANVTRLLDFQRQGLDSLDGASIDTYYQGVVASLGVQSAAARDRSAGSEAIRAAIQNQREAISGVSIDEETVKLIQYQSGYQAAARFISTVDELIQVLLNM